MIDTPAKEAITDIDRMKNELLSYINQIETKVDMKLSLYETRQETSLNKFQKQLETMGTQYALMSETVTEQKVKIGKIEELETFKRKGEDQLISQEIRLNNLRKEYDRSVDKYDRIYVDNLVVPGYVGECAQYKNMREYIDNNISQVASLTASREKLTVDLKEYKTKLEGLISLFSSQVEKYNKNQVEYINSKHTETKAYIAEQMKIINDEFIELRMTNCKYAVELKAKASELNIEWEKMHDLKKEIYKHYDEKVNEFKATERQTNLNVFELKNEYKKVKNKFNELVDFIKDVRFRRNLEKDNFEGVKKKEIINLAKKLGCNRMNSRSFDLGNRKEVDIDYKYDYYKGENVGDAEEEEAIDKNQIKNIKGFNSNYNTNNNTEPNNNYKAICNTIGNEDSIRGKDKMNETHNKPRNIKITINDYKDQTEKSNLSRGVEMKRVTTAPKKSLSPDVAMKRKKKPADTDRPEILRVVALNYDQETKKDSLFKMTHNQMNAPNSINVSFRPMIITRNEHGKKFNTVKESKESMKISFGASVINAKESKVYKDSIDCSQKANCNFALVSQNKLKQSP